MSSCKRIPAQSIQRLFQPLVQPLVQPRQQLQPRNQPEFERGSRPVSHTVVFSTKLTQPTRRQIRACKPGGEAHRARKIQNILKKAWMRLLTYTTNERKRAYALRRLSAAGGGFRRPSTPPPGRLRLSNQWLG